MYLLFAHSFLQQRTRASAKQHPAERPKKGLEKDNQINPFLNIHASINTPIFFLSLSLCVSGKFTLPQIFSLHLSLLINTLPLSALYAFKSLSPQARPLIRVSLTLPSKSLDSLHFPNHTPLFKFSSSSTQAFLSRNLQGKDKKQSLLQSQETGEVKKERNREIGRAHV